MSSTTTESQRYMNTLEIRYRGASTDWAWPVTPVIPGASNLPLKASRAGDEVASEDASESNVRQARHPTHPPSAPTKTVDVIATHCGNDV